MRDPVILYGCSIQIISQSSFAKEMWEFLILHLRTCDQCQSLHASKVSMFYGHDTGSSKELLGVVIDQLSGEKKNL